MARYHSLTIYVLARENLRDIARITQHMPGFGDLANQMRRAAISTVSNISEGVLGGAGAEEWRAGTLAACCPGPE